MTVTFANTLVPCPKLFAQRVLVHFLSNLQICIPIRLRKLKFSCKKGVFIVFFLIDFFFFRFPACYDRDTTRHDLDQFGLTWNLAFSTILGLCAEHHMSCRLSTFHITPNRRQNARSDWGYKSSIYIAGSKPLIPKFTSAHWLDSRLFRGAGAHFLV